MRDMPDQGNQRSIRDILGVVFGFKVGLPTLYLGRLQNKTNVEMIHLDKLGYGLSGLRRYYSTVIYGMTQIN